VPTVYQFTGADDSDSDAGVFGGERRLLCNSRGDGMRTFHRI
jgi:hypothetical protein